MYYEEQEIDGKWYFRCVPRGAWIEFSTDKYVAKIRELQTQVTSLEASVAIKEARLQFAEALEKIGC
jgi:hypothetical protein